MLLKKQIIFNKQQGASLIEVLISMVILGIGLLGMAGIQLYSAKSNINAYYRTQANILAKDMLDRMRANKRTALSGGYFVGFSGSLPRGNAIATDDVKSWRSSLRNTLPEGKGRIERCDGGICTVEVRWKKKDSKNTQAVKHIRLTTQL